MGLSFWSEKKSEAAVSQELLLFRSKNDLVIGDLCNTHWSSLSRQARPLGIVALSVVDLFVFYCGGQLQEEQEAQAGLFGRLLRLLFPLFHARRWRLRMRPSERDTAGQCSCQKRSCALARRCA